MLTEVQVATLIKQIAMTLNQLHELNVLHRDLRIESIGVKDGYLALGSFDLAY